MSINSDDAKNIQMTEADNFDTEASSPSADEVQPNEGDATPKQLMLDAAKSLIEKIESGECVGMIVSFHDKNSASVHLVGGWSIASLIAVGEKTKESIYEAIGDSLSSLR